MAEKVYNVRVLQKQDLTDNWNSSSTILKDGEIGIEVLDSGKKKIKIGDGISTWSNLSYLETEAAANILDGIANGSIRTSLAAAETTEYRLGNAAFASGQNTKASGNFSDASNFGTIASGGYSHAEGRETQAKGSASHAGGYGTIAGSKNQTVIGKYNIEDSSDTYAFIIGDGENTNSRANLFTVAWDGEVQVDGKKLATEEYVGTNGGKIDSISVNGNTQTITNKNVNITVPTKTSEITNDSNFATVSQIPTKTSDLTNDSNFAIISQIPTKVSQLENDKNYLTTHQDISGKADKTYVDSQIAEANKYTDDSVANLLNNSSEAVDSVMELAAAMEDNKDAIDALTEISGNKADKSYVTEQINNAMAEVDTIIDVLSLPTSDINDGAFYRLLKPVWVVNGMVENSFKVYPVETLPSVGEMAYDGTVAITYYNLSDGKVYGYINDILSGSFGVPVGWYDVGLFIPGMTEGLSYGGVVESMEQATEENVMYVVHTYKLYSYKTEWESLNGIGKPGTGGSAEIFNDSSNIASGGYSHAEGYLTTASEYASHAEGYLTTASGYISHAEGQQTIASGYYAHAEGIQTTASEYASHAEGTDTTASGSSSHAEGWLTTASGDHSHAEGYNTCSEGIQSHAEGHQTKALGATSHAEGGRQYITEIDTEFEEDTNSGPMSLRSTSPEEQSLDGVKTLDSYEYEDWDGNTYTIKGSTAIGLSSHAEGIQTVAYGEGSHSEGRENVAYGIYSHAEGHLSNADGDCSHVEGFSNGANGFASHSEGIYTNANTTASHAEGYHTQVRDGFAAHAEGYYTLADGKGSHAEGGETFANVEFAHAEGYNTRSEGYASHTEGCQTSAYGHAAHAEGGILDENEEELERRDSLPYDDNVYDTCADGIQSHAEGTQTYAYGYSSHSEGYQTDAIGKISHAEGKGTVAAGDIQHAQGKFNIFDYTSAHIVGNGEDSDNRSNAHTLDWSGNAWYAGDVYVGSTSGKNKDEGSKKLATEDFVNNSLANFTGGSQIQILTWEAND